MSLVKQQPPILGSPTETSFLRLSRMMDLNFTGSGSFNFSKATGYQEGSSCDLFLVQTRNNWYLGPFMISELGIFN